MLVTVRGEIARRRAMLQHAPDLAALGERLSRLAAPLLDGPVYVPEQKALLSRDGGRCSNDGSRLTFDPSSPDRHRCPACGKGHEGSRHHRAWIWRYHIWLSERAIHLALLDVLGVIEGGRGGARAKEILAAYADRYRSYPNADNVLGPTRLFFSTYLESIWLTQIVIAASLLEWPEGDPLYDKLQSMVQESSMLIGSFDEAWSNRQVWNNTALVAAGRWIGDESMVKRAVESEHGIEALLSRAVSDSGWWHEGENYHFFALRGFLLAAELLRPAGVDLYGGLPDGRRLARMYVAPLSTVLPDLSVPARGDSPFAVTLLQPRFAELWEIGWARTGDPLLESILVALYRSDADSMDDHGFAEIAEVEENRSGQRLTRRELGWKALLCMREAAPEAERQAWQSGSVFVEPGGPCVLRDGSDRYVSLECGGTGGGHGHPDRLHLTLFWGAPWLLDFGTGSYVSESLHWYRSTLAHNAPGVVGVGQGQVRGTAAWCAAFDAQDGWGWCRGIADGILGPDTRVVRSVIAGPEYVLDVVDVDAPDSCQVDLPLHLLGRLKASPIGSVEAVGESEAEFRSGHESGYSAVSGVGRFATAPDRVCCVAGDRRVDVLLAPRLGESCFIMQAPGPPTLALADTARHEFLVRRASGSGRWVQLHTLRGEVGDLFASVRADDKVIRIERQDGTTECVTLEDGAVRITRVGKVLALLEGTRPAPDPVRSVVRTRVRVRCELLESLPTPHDYFEVVSPETVVRLGRAHYRRSESEYPGSDNLEANVAVAAHGSRLLVGIDVRKPDLVFRSSDEPDPLLDNEAPDIHSDGVQCYVDRNGWHGFVAVPHADSDEVHVRPVVGTMARGGGMVGSWSRTEQGYVMLLSFETGGELRKGDTVPLNVVVNEMRPMRSRRAGQLALGGGGGWVYLRGDRESPDSAVLAEVW